MDIRERELRQHIATLFHHYGEDLDYFEEYVNGVLKYSLNKSLKCFRELVSHIKTKEKVINVKRLQGMLEQSENAKSQFQSAQRKGKRGILE